MSGKILLKLGVSCFFCIISILLALGFCLFFQESAYANRESSQAENGALSAKTSQSLVQSDFSAPTVHSIEMEQAYKTIKFDGAVYNAAGKAFGKGKKPYAAWSDCNVVEITFRNVSAQQAPPGVYISYCLQRSTSQSGGFITVNDGSSMQSIAYESVRTKSNENRRPITDIGNGNYRICDCQAKRGNKYFYRVVAKYKYYDNEQGRETIVEKASNVVSIRTTPKTFIAKSFKVKTSKGWKSQASSKMSFAKFKKSKNKLSHTYKISWKKRNDVSGYYVYKVNIKKVKLKNLKSWQYAETGYSEAIGGLGKASYGNRSTAATAKRYCKKVATLKASATSYKFSIKDASSYSALQHPAYVIVPYLKQNGKTYLGDAKYAYHAYSSGFGGGSGNIAKYKMLAYKKPYGKYVPFALQ